ncbi:MAG: hypothetical protein GXO87_02645 [Chlorobi bacterium]|nr:hypothetical protein [Chlorobiota bacterium]
MGGGALSDMRIDSSQTVTLNSIYPPLQMKLNDETYDSLFVILSALKDVDDIYRGQCADDITNKIVFNSGDYRKTVEVDNCRFFADSLSADLAAIKTAMNKLDEIWSRTYNASAEWSGLRYLFDINKSVFSVGDTLMISCTIQNPTNVKKTIYFPHQEKFLIYVSKQNDPSFHFVFPEFSPDDTSSANILSISPNGSKELKFYWDLSVNAPDEPKSFLDIGKYNLSARLYFNYSTTQNFGFEVIDAALPISAVIMPDYNGESSSQEVYIFKLKIKNWTDNTVNLHFPFVQKIYVTLYDLNFPEPGPIIFQGPDNPDVNQSIMSLSPGEEITFEYPVNKNQIALNSFWTFAEIKLLCDDFELISTGELRIFKYNP